MPFTLYYLDATYKRNEAPSNVVGCGMVCTSMSQALEERERIQNLFKVESVTITEKTFGGSCKW
jgi:hypothetical protein